jgi:acyl-CoA thioesterase
MERSTWTWYQRSVAEMDDDSRFDSRFLGKLCAQFLSIPTSFPENQKDAVKSLMTFVHPTLSMSMEVKRDPKDAEWLFVRVEWRKAEKGRFSVDVTMLNEEGKLVAIARLVILMMEISAGMKLVGSTLKL